MRLLFFLFVFNYLLIYVNYRIDYSYTLFKFDIVILDIILYLYLNLYLIYTSMHDILNGIFTVSTTPEKLTLYTIMGLSICNSIFMRLKKNF